MSPRARLTALIEGSLAANIFDWGAAACVELYHNGVAAAHLPEATLCHALNPVLAWVLLGSASRLLHGCFPMEWMLMTDEVSDVVSSAYRRNHLGDLP